MKNPIGFVFREEIERKKIEPLMPQGVMPVKSLVQVYFPERNQTLTYFNDQFDLKPGNYVFVEGKLESQRGIVRQVSKNFKIKAADYKKVIGVADVGICGRMHMAGSHFVSFDRTVKEEEEYETGCDDTVILLEELGKLPVSEKVWERGREYYLENRVCYLCVDGGCGRAIVEGTRAYEVEFDFANGEIRNLLCSCPCGDTCKHQVATLMQLRETLKKFENHYSDLHGEYFAAIAKGELFRFAIDGNETGTFTL